jgi:hypothetical protein
MQRLCTTTSHLLSPRFKVEEAAPSTTKEIQVFSLLMAELCIIMKLCSCKEPKSADDEVINHSCFRYGLTHLFFSIKKKHTESTCCRPRCGPSLAVGVPSTRDPMASHYGVVVGHTANAHTGKQLLHNFWLYGNELHYVRDVRVTPTTNTNYLTMLGCVATYCIT